MMSGGVLERVRFFWEESDVNIPSEHVNMEESDVVRVHIDVNEWREVKQFCLKAHLFCVTLRP